MRSTWHSGAGTDTVHAIVATLAVGVIGVIGVIVGAGCDEEPSPLAPDLEPPAVLVFEPADRAVWVGAEVVVRVEFDEPVVIDSLAAPPLRLDGPDGPLESIVVLDSLALVLTLMPVAELAPGTEFRAVLAAGISDLDGNVRTDSVAVRFTTGLEFHDIGRIFTANEISRDLTVLDVVDYAPVQGSPVALDVYPRRLCADPAAGLVHLLYWSNGAVGVRSFDARSLLEVGDSGPVLPVDAADLAVDSANGLLLVAAPETNAIFTLDAATLAVLGEPLVFDREDSEPMRLAVSERHGLLLVGLFGGARMDARRLPSLDPVAGFPVDAVERVRVIRVDEERGRAWVVGDLRYAVVDLVNPARTYTFSMPVTVCRRCAPTIWSMVLSPAHDRAFFQNRRQSLFAVRLSDLELAPEGPTRLNHIDFMNDIQLNPRTGELVVLLWGNIRSGMILVSSATLERSGTLPPVGDKALHMVVMP